MKRYLSKFKIRLDFVRSYILSALVVLVIANDYNNVFANFFGLDYRVMWVLLVLFMFLVIGVVTYFFVDVFGFYEVDDIEKRKLSPFYHGKLTPVNINFVKGVYLPLMEKVGCDKEEVDRVRRLVETGDWRKLNGKKA